MRLLVIRTSAMGDVALTTPVLKGMREQFPDVEMTLLTRAAFKPFFNSIGGLRFFFPDLKKRHKGLTGIFRLFRDINREDQFDHIIDLHDVLRSKILRLLFRMKGISASVIDKGRNEKKKLIKGHEKKFLRHSVDRYCDVFSKAGYPVVPSKERWIVPPENLELNETIRQGMKGFLNIGVAPYAKHKLKMWPESNMAELLRLISKDRACRFWLFGGPEDSKNLENFQSQVEGAVNLSGNLSLEEELLLMSRLDFMIAMDSSNMHMAALTGTRVVSIWGGTDPMSGFSAWMQPDNLSVRIPADELTCRPCTTFGKGECKRGDFACMNWLTPEMVYKRIEKHVLR